MSPGTVDSLVGSGAVLFAAIALVGALTHAALTIRAADQVDALEEQMYGSYEMYEERREHHGGHVSVSEAREAFADLVNRAAYGGERVLVSRRGKPVAAIVPIADVEFIERMEDELDLQAAREALADPERGATIPWDRVKAELEL